jgi:hypothetical protein
MTHPPALSSLPLPLLPPHYRDAFKGIIRFVLVMVLVALVVGVAYAESAKKVSLGDFPVEIVFHANYVLSLVHGHAFMFGVFLPTAMLGLLSLAVIGLGWRPIGPAALRWGFGFYLPSAVWSFGLILYKAYAVQLAVRSGLMDMAVVDQQLFAGNHLLRVLIYALPHTGLAIGLGILVIALWRSAGSAPKAVNV